MKDEIEVTLTDVPDPVDDGHRFMYVEGGAMSVCSRCKFRLTTYTEKIPDCPFKEDPVVPPLP